MEWLVRISHKLWHHHHHHPRRRQKQRRRQPTRQTLCLAMLLIMNMRQKLRSLPLYLPQRKWSLVSSSIRRQWARSVVGVRLTAASWLTKIKSNWCCFLDDIMDPWFSFYSMCTILLTSSLSLPPRRDSLFVFVSAASGSALKSFLAGGIGGVMAVLVSIALDRIWWGLTWSALLWPYLWSIDDWTLAHTWSKHLFFYFFLSSL